MNLFALEPRESAPILLHEPGEHLQPHGSNDDGRTPMESMFAMNHVDRRSAAGIVVVAAAASSKTPSPASAAPHPHDSGLLLLPDRGPWLTGPLRESSRVPSALLHASERHGGAAAAGTRGHIDMRTRSSISDDEEDLKGMPPLSGGKSNKQHRRRAHQPFAPPSPPLQQKKPSKQAHVSRRKGIFREDEGAGHDDDDDSGERTTGLRTRKDGGRLPLNPALRWGTLQKASAAGLAMYVAFCAGYLLKVHVVAPTGWRSLWGGASWGPVHLTVPGSDSTRWEEALQAASRRYLMAGTAPLSRMEGFAWHHWLQVSSKLGCDAVAPASRIADSRSLGGGNGTTSTTVASVPTRSPLCFCAQSEFLGHLARSLGHIAAGLNRSSLSSSLKDPFMQKALDLVNADKATSYTEGIGACILRHSAGSRSTMLLGQWCASGQRWELSGKQQGPRRLPFYLTLDPYSLIAGVLLAPVLLCNAPWLFLLLLQRVRTRGHPVLPGGKLRRKGGTRAPASGEGSVTMLHLGTRLGLLILLVACSVPVDVLAGKASRTEGLGGWVVLVLVAALFSLALAWGLLDRVERLWHRLFWCVPKALREGNHCGHYLPSWRDRASSAQRANACFYKGYMVQMPLLCVLGDVLTLRRGALLDVSNSFMSGVLAGLLAATLQECAVLYSVFRRQQQSSFAPLLHEGSSAPDGHGGTKQLGRHQQQQQQQGHPAASQQIWRLDSSLTRNHAGGLSQGFDDNAAVLRIVRGFHIRSSDMAWSAFAATLGVLQGQILWRMGFLIGPTIYSPPGSEAGEVQLVLATQFAFLCIPFLDTLHLLPDTLNSDGGPGPAARHHEGQWSRGPFSGNRPWIGDTYELLLRVKVLTEKAGHLCLLAVSMYLCWSYN